MTSPPDPKHSRTLKRSASAVTRNAILSATAQLFVERGLTATRTRDVTACAGVSTGLLNHYFSWAQLRAEALDLALKHGLDQILPAANLQSDDPRGDLERLADSAFDDAADPLWRLWIEATEAAPADQAVAQALADSTGVLVTRIAGRLRRGIELGCWTCADPDGAAFRLMALHDGLAGLILSGLPELTRSAASKHMAVALALECPPCTDR